MAPEKSLVICEVEIEHECYEDIDTIIDCLQEIKRRWTNEWSKDWSRMELEFGHDAIGDQILSVYVFRNLSQDEEIHALEMEVEGLTKTKERIGKSLHLKRMKLQDLRNVKQRSQNGKSKQ